MGVIRKIGRTIYKCWMAFAHFLAAVNAAVLLIIVYLVVVGPMSLISRLLRKDLMAHRTPLSGSFWKTKEPIPHTLDQARHQF
jgi:hypothetical protein